MSLRTNSIPCDDNVLDKEVHWDFLGGGEASFSASGFWESLGQMASADNI